jgi:aspartate aminotransferase-like enzyme
MIDHRGRVFGEILNRVTDRLKYFFQTTNDVFLLTCSGTGGMEAAVVNTLSPGDRVLVISIGAFGDRFANIAETYGAEVTRLNFEWGTAADPEEVRKALAADPSIKAVLVTHNETSTGVTNPADIARVVRETDKFSGGCVSSLGSVPFYTDDWGSIAVTASRREEFSPARHGLSEPAAGRRQGKMPRFSWTWQGQGLSGPKPDAVDTADIGGVRPRLRTGRPGARGP